MKTHLIKISAVALFLSVGFVACKKDSINTESQEQIQSLMLSGTDQNTYSELSNLLYNDIKSNGIIYNALIQEFVRTENEEFLMVDIYNSITESGDISDATLELYNILLQNPELTVAIPSLELSDGNLKNYLDNFDEIVTLDRDFRTTPTLYAITFEGEQTETSSIFDESKKYIVVKRSEKFLAVNVNTLSDMSGNSVSDLINNITPQKIFENYKFYISENLYNLDLYTKGQLLTGYKLFETLDNDEPSTPKQKGYDFCINSGRTQNELTNANRKDQLHSVKFDDMKAVRKAEAGWNLPNIELRAVYAVYNVSTGAVEMLNKTFTTHKKYNGSFISPLDLDIVFWRYEQFGDLWRVEWIEEEPHGAEVKFNVGLSVKFKIGPAEATANASVEISIKKHDEKLGSVMIPYCDPINTINGETYKVYDVNGSGFHFRERLKP